MLLQSETQVFVNVYKLFIAWFGKLDKEHIKSFHQERLSELGEVKKF